MSETFRILLVEDNPGDARLIQEYLKDVPLMNVELGVVGTLEKAQKMLEEGNYDLVLLDLGLPDSAGLDTATEVIASSPSIPVVVLTGLADHKRAMEAINGGAQDYLVKDLINTDVLVRSIRYSIHRKQSRVEVEESELKYRSLWDNSANGLAYHEVVTDDEGKPIDSIFLDVNTGFEKITGKRKEDVIGKRFSEVKLKMMPKGIDPKDTFWKVALTGEPMSIEFYNQKIHRWFSVSVYSPTRGTFVCALQDITERKLSEQTVLESEEKFRSVFEDSAIANNMHDSAGILMEANQACVELFGVQSAEDLHGFKLFEDPNMPDDVKKKVLSGETVRVVSEFSFDKVKKHSLYKTSKSGIMYLDTVIAPFGKTEQGSVLGYYVQMQDITDQVRANELLAESEKTFRTLFEDSPLSYQSLDEDGNFLHVNKKWLETLGYSQKDVIGRSFADFIHIEDQDSFKVYFPEFKKVGEVSGIEFRMRHYDGKYRDVSFEGIVRSDEHGHFISTHCVFIDITEQKKAAAALRESEARYRGIYEHAAFGVILSILGDEVIDVNPALENMLGYTHEEFCKMKISDFSYPEDDVVDKNLSQQILQGETESFKMEKRYIKKNGDMIWANLSVSVIRNDRGHIEFFIGIIEDITEKKQVEANLKFERERYISVLNILEDGIYVVDHDYNIEYINNVIEREFGPVTERKCFSYLHDRKEPCPWCKNDQVFAGNTVRWEWYSKKNDRYYDLLDTPMKNADGSISKFEVFRDITEQKLAEDKIRESEVRFRGLFEKSPIGIELFDIEGQLIDANQATMDLFGISTIDQIMGFKLFEDPNLSDEVKEKLRRGEQVDYQTEFDFEVVKEQKLYETSKSGSIHLDLMISPMILGGGDQIDSYIVHVRDITDRWLAEDGLKASEERFKQFFEKAPVYCYMVSPQSILLDVNEAALSVLGYTKDELIGKPLKTIYSPASLHKLDILFTNWEKTGKLQSESMEIITKTGEKRSVLLSTESIKDSDESAMHSISVQIDVTEQVKAESLVIQERNRAQSYLDIAGVIFVALDEKGIITMMNQRACEILYCVPKDYIGKNWFDSFIPEKLRKDVSNVYVKLMSGNIENVKYYENEVLTTEGEERTIAWNNTLLTDTDGRIIGTLSSGEDITERKLAEEALRDSEEKYRILYEKLSDALFLSDKDGLITLSNEMALNLFGYHKNEILGMHFTELLHPEDRKRVIESHEMHLKSGEPVLGGFEAKACKKDGTYFDIHITNTILMEEGKPSGYQSLIHDITERKRSEHALRESEERYRELYQNVRVGMATTTVAGGKIVQCNAHIAEVFGFESSEQFIAEGIVPELYVNPDDRHHMISELKKTGVYDGELALKKMDGTHIWADVAVHLDLEDGTIKTAFMNITDRKRAEEALIENEMRFRLLFETAPLATAHVSLDGTIYQTNTAFEKIFGYSQEESKLLTVDSITHPDDWEKETKLAQEMEAGLRDTFEIEKRFFHKDGHQIWGNLNVALTRNQEGKAQFVVGTVEDITDRKKNEEALRRSEERHRLVLSSMSDLIFVLDQNNDYIEFYASEQFAPFSSPDEFLGKNVKDILQSDVAQRLIECANRVRITGDRETVEYSLTRDNKEDWFLAALDRHYDGESIVMAARNITVRKRAVDDVKERESEYRTLVSNIPGAVYHCAFDKHWTMFFLSDAFEDISGYPASDFIMNQTRSFTSIIHPDDRKYVVDETTKSINQRESYTLEYRIIGADGMVHWIREYGKGISESDNEVDYLDGIVFDITEEKLAQNEMTRLRDVQRASFELSLALGETLELDKIYETVYKHIEQVMDTSIFIVSHYDNKTKQITAGYVNTDEGPVDVQKFPPIPLEDEGMGTQSQVIRSGSPLYLPDLVSALEKTKTEYTIKSEGEVKEGPPPDDGIQRSKSAILVPLLYANEVIGVMQVQSYERNAYSKSQLDLISNLGNVVALAVQNAKLFDTVEESEDRFRLLVEGTLDGVFIHENLVFLDMNQRMAEMIGKDRADLIGENVIDYWTPESQKLLHEYVQAGEDNIFELDLLRSDGSTYKVEAIGQDCLYEGKKARIVATRNITEEQKAQEKTKQAADTALLYLDIMSHDVRNQLQAVIMASEILEHMELDVENMLALEIITESVAKSQKLINKVLATRELLSIPLSDVSLKSALESSLDSLNKIFDEIEIKTNYPPEDPMVVADKFIEHLLMNILENAVEYNEKKDRKLWIDIQESENGYQVAIKDNGQGINDEKKDSLFDPSRRFGGVGIHQTIRILQKYGGQISVHNRVESDMTQGTEFRLWFPKAKSSS